MFDKILKGLKKNEEKAKPQEQKDYEEKQKEAEKFVVDTFRSCVNVLRENGWQILPVWKLTNPNMPFIAVSQIEIHPIQYEDKLRIDEALKKQKEKIEAAKLGDMKTESKPEASTTPDEQNKATDTPQGEMTVEEPQEASENAPAKE